MVQAIRVDLPVRVFRSRKRFFLSTPLTPPLYVSLNRGAHFLIQLQETPHTFTLGVKPLALIKPVDGSIKNLMRSSKLRRH